MPTRLEKAQWTLLCPTPWGGDDSSTAEPDQPDTITNDDAAQFLFGLSYETLPESGPHKGLAVMYAQCVNYGDEFFCAQVEDYLNRQPPHVIHLLILELLGLADVERCFGHEDGESCAWMIASITPAKLLKLLKARKLDKSTSFCSFTGNTRVLMADGTTKPISEIRPGDKVLSTDPETGKQTVQTVVAVWAHEDVLVDLVVLSQSESGIASVTGMAGVSFARVTTTADHPFWNDTDQQWQPAASLDAGDQLLTAVGDGPTVAGLLEYTEHHGTAYNLTIAATHTYHVLASDVSLLVHNCTGPVTLSDDVLDTHILPLHGPGTPGAGSKFADSIDIQSYGRLANDAVRNSPVPVRTDPVTGNHLHIHDFGSGNVIGTLENGQQTTRLFVWVNSHGNVVSMYPG